MARQSKAQKDTIERVMHEFKHGELKIRGDGPKVKNPKQAIAIALREAGASNQESPQENRKNLRKTKKKEQHGEVGQGRGRAEAKGRREGAERRSTRAELYEEAIRRQVPGRSKMSKPELERALSRSP